MAINCYLALAPRRAAFIDGRLDSDVSVRVATIADPRGLQGTAANGKNLLKVRVRALVPHDIKLP